MKRLPSRLVLLAGLVGALHVAAPAQAQPQSQTFQSHPFGFAGPAGMAGAPWGWWSIGQPLLATGLWIDPMGLTTSAAGSASALYRPSSATLATQPVPALGWGWQPSWAGTMAPGFAVQFYSSPFLNGVVLNAW